MFRNVLKCFSILAVFCPSSMAQAQYAYFSRDTDTIAVSGRITLTNAATIEAYARLTSPTTGILFSEWLSGLDDKTLYVSQKLMQGYFYPFHSGVSIQAAMNLTADNFHHIAYVYDGSQERLYLDGVLLASLMNSGNIGNGNGSGFVGARYRDAFNKSVQGYVDTLRISDIARYSGASFVPPIGDLPTDSHTLLLYNFDEPSTSLQINDLSGHGHTGVLGTGFGGATAPVLGPGPSALVAGTITLGDCNDPEQNITFEFRPKPSGTPFRVKQVLTQSGPNTGIYSFANIPVGTYDIAIKGYCWLQRVLPNVVVSGDVTGLNATLINADLNNDNQVDCADFGILVNDYSLVGDD